VPSRSGRTDPSANRAFIDPGCGVKKSYGSDQASFRSLYPNRAVTMQCGGNASDWYTGASGVVRTVAWSITPAHGAWTNDPARSPTATVFAVPSVTWRTWYRVFRTNSPVPSSGATTMSPSAPKHAA
jgi:hypothetical protein